MLRPHTRVNERRQADCGAVGAGFEATEMRRIKIAIKSKILSGMKEVCPYTPAADFAKLGALWHSTTFYWKRKKR